MRKTLFNRFKDKTRELDFFGKGLTFKFGSSTIPGGLLSIFVRGIYYFFIFNLVYKMTFYQADKLNSVVTLVDETQNVTFSQANMKMFMIVDYRNKDGLDWEDIGDWKKYAYIVAM